MGWQSMLNLGMKTDPVTHVYKIGLLGSDPLGKSQCLAQALVREMRQLTQGIKHQHPDTFQLREFRLRQAFDICHISQVANTETQYRQFSVHHPDRNHPYARHLERRQIDLTHKEIRDARIAMLPENIGQACTDRLNHIALGIDLHTMLPAHGSHVVQATDMVVMLVRQQDRVQMADPVPDHLPAKIGAAINQQAFPVDLYQSGGPQTPITRILAPANLTLTTDLWIARRSSRA